MRPRLFARRKETNFMRQERGSNGSTRSSALWGKPGKGETRSSALWGKGGRGFAMALVALMVMVAPVAATAGPGKGKGDEYRAYLSPGLYEAARANPKASFQVIVQGQDESSSGVAAEVGDARKDHPGKGRGVLKKFRSITGVSAELSGRQILKLAGEEDIAAITSDAPVVLTGSRYTSKEAWPFAANVARDWRSELEPPTIAIVDSGIEANRADFDFGSRIVDVQVMTKLEPNSPGDGRGHGTFVAGIAAGSAPGKAGAAPKADIVMLDVMDDRGMAMTSDVIAAADWIYANREAKNIRVANFSLHSSVPNSFMFDPLNKAVQKLWFGGVVVVAAAGNYGVDGAPSGVPYAPGNDPFVITVGAVDIDGSRKAHDDVAAPWSAYGYTLDGFAKPDLGAPGRYIVGPIPGSSTLLAEKPENAKAAGYMQLSGTSFAAPVVAGAAAQILAAHPGWTPDQVKGALMLTAQPLPFATPLSVGVGELNAATASRVANPPNPNAALNRFVVSESGGSGRVFDAASWANVARADASWASASWASASWANASWASASWASASWASASWASASWASASWASASWASLSYEDNAEGEAPAPAGGTSVDLLDLYAAELEYGFDLNDDGLVGAPPALP
jgi:serine protease AprX